MSLTISQIFELYAREYLKKFGSNIPFVHLKAIRDIISCRSPVMGGTTYYCTKCNTFHYSYHSCKNRNCPKCQYEDNHRWLDKQLEKLLPVSYFLVTFTIPSEFRSITRTNQKAVLSILFKTAAESLQEFAQDPKFIGAKTGMTGVLHTWTRTLIYHPHIHFIVPAGGYDTERNTWNKSHNKFLFPVKALSKVFRAKFRDALNKSKFTSMINSSVWKKDFIVHSKPVGKGKSALKYLAQYVHKIAISNNKITKVEKHKVTFRYIEANSGKEKNITLDVIEFIRRYLQHVLPTGFQKVRYYGFMSSAAKRTLNVIKSILSANNLHNNFESSKKKYKTGIIFKCPKCGKLMIKKKENRYYNRPPPKIWLKFFLRHSFAS